MNIDTNNEETILRIKNMIIERIENNEYIAGEAIPSERELASAYGVSRSVVRTAIDSLVRHRYLDRIPGSGTFVRKPDFTKIALGVLQENENTSFSLLARKFGINHSNKLISAGILTKSRYFAHKLCLSETDKIYGIQRVRIGNHEPMVLEYTFMPYHLFPDIENYNFERLSLYDYMALKNHLPISFQETVRMQQAPQHVKRALKTDADDEIINYMEITGFDRFGNLVEYTQSYSKPYNLEVRFTTNGTV